jgi:site-specific DNA-adenine methylase
VLKKAKPGDFCFIDSPYDEINNYQFTYNTSDKDKNDFVQELYIELQKLDKKNVRWLMTQADTKPVRKRFKEYTIETFPVFRGFSNTYKNELIIKNYYSPTNQLWNTLFL